MNTKTNNDVTVVRQQLNSEVTASGRPLYTYIVLVNGKKVFSHYSAAQAHKVAAKYT